jgi:hypothetical protein
LKDEVLEFVAIRHSRQGDSYAPKEVSDEMGMEAEGNEA